MPYDFAYFKTAADYIQSRTSVRPEIGLILGSDLGAISDKIEVETVIDYKDIPNFLLSTVPSHAGKLILGTLEGKSVVCMSGRFHYYEGYGFEELVVPVRVMKLLGIRALILTNAAGGINPLYRPGDVMLIRDHIKLNGASPLRGQNVPEFGPRFFDVSDMYTASLRAKALELGKDSGLTVHEGVYYFAPGPQFETPAEIRAMSILGADAVGMSSVTEAITAAHCSLPLLGLSVITNMAAGIQKTVSAEEVGSTMGQVMDKLSAYVCRIVKSI